MEEVSATQRGVTPDEGCKNGLSAWKNQFGFTAFDGHSYDGACSFFQEPALSQTEGWIILLGIGAFCALLTSAMVFLGGRRQSDDGESQRPSEVFTTAGRCMSTGFTAADVVSKWTWAATLLQSSNVAYRFGVSGPFWYAAGATIQILLFSVVAVEIKRKCPAIHTVLEVVHARWGTHAHMIFLFFCLLTNLIVSAMLILGGSAVVSALTGVDTTAACFIIPLGVATYTVHGGLRGTFYAAWTHVAVIFIIMLVFVWQVYVGPSDLGSSDKVWEHLQIMSVKNPVEGNHGGSFLTMISKSGIVFGVVNIVGNFGTVFVDQSYWQGAIAAKPSASWKGYLLGGLAWFAIPFTLASTLGLSARALDLPVTLDEAAAGLVPPAVALHLLGKGGAFLVALQVFLAVTASANSEQLAVASLLAYDVYKRYWRPSCSGAEVIAVSRAGVVAWAVVSAVSAVVLLNLKLSLGWVYLAMGNFVGPAVVPICMSLLWKDCTRDAAIGSAVLGLVGALTGWMVMAAREEEGLTVETLGRDAPMLTGNLLALLVSGFSAWALSEMTGGQDFDWARLDELTRRNLVEHDPAAYLHYDHSDDPAKALEAAYSTSVKASLALSFLLVILWPLLSLPQDPFSKEYFRLWVLLAIIWGNAAALITVVYPLWEARGALVQCFRPAQAPPSQRTVNLVAPGPGTGSSDPALESHAPGPVNIVMEPDSEVGANIAASPDPLLGFDCRPREEKEGSDAQVPRGMAGGGSELELLGGGSELLVSWPAQAAARHLARGEGGRGGGSLSFKLASGTL